MSSSIINIKPSTNLNVTGFPTFIIRDAKTHPYANIFLIVYGRSSNSRFSLRYLAASASGEAADITVGSPALNKRLFDLVVSLQKKGKIQFDQLIWEKGSAVGPDWIHVSYRQGRNRNQILHL